MNNPFNGITKLEFSFMLCIFYSVYKKMKINETNNLPISYNDTDNLTFRELAATFIVGFWLYDEMQKSEVKTNDIKSLTNFCAGDNDLIKLLKIFPNKNWNYEELSRNPNITLKYVMENKNKPWNWRELVKNSGITINDLLSYPEQPWFMDSMLDNPNLTMAYVLDRFELSFGSPTNKIPLLFKHMTKISRNPGIKLEDVIKNPKLIWNYEALSENPNITLDFVLQNLNKSWNWQNLSKNPSITLKDISSHLELLWDYNYLSQNPNINIDFVKTHDTKSWNYSSLIHNPGIKIEDILSYNKFEFYRRFCSICGNPNLDIKDIITKDAFNKIIIWDLVKKHPNITPEDIKKHLPDKAYTETYWENPNLTYESIMASQQILRINWTNLSKNLFQKHPHLDPPICYI